MSNLTPNLELFKYDLSTDGKQSFNITQSLNDNWDALDNAYLELKNMDSYLESRIDNIKPNYLIDSYSDGNIWYRQYSDGWKEMGGYVATSSSQVVWTNPKLTNSNGIWNGNYFAVKGIDNAYILFDGDTTSTRGYTGSNQPLNIYVYNPIPIKLTLYNQVAVSGYAYKYPPHEVTIAVSNDEVEWTNLVIKAALNRSNFSETPISLNTDVYARYVRMTYYNSDYTAQCYLREIMLKGIVKTESQNSITFPIAFRDTNYSYCLSFQNSSGADTYVTTKTTTGMSLSNTSQGRTAWIAMGY